MNWVTDLEAIAKDYCILLSFSRNDFLKLKELFPEMEKRI